MRLFQRRIVAVGTASGTRHSPLTTRHSLFGFQRRITAVATASAIALFITIAQGQGRWGKRAPFPEPSQEIYGVAVSGKLYVFGGLSAAVPDSTPKGLVYEYDAAGDQWSKKKPMPVPAHHIAAAEYGGKIYLFGGGTQRQPGGPNWWPSNNAWEYDPSADSWKALAPMPTERGAAAAVAVGDKIYVIGGAGAHPGAQEASLSATQPHRALSTNEVYDPRTDKWETRSPMPTARNHAAIGAVNGKIYVIGGRVGSAFVVASNSDIVEEYDPAADTWSIRARMPTPRSGVAFGTLGGRIYVAGGEFLDNEMVGVFRDLEAYDPATNQWITLPPLLTPRHGLVGGVIGNRFYAVSGHLQSGGVGGSAADSNANEAFEVTLQ